MAAIVGAAGSRHNVEITLVPMIDLMSCLTAFLLVTAVWVNTAQLELRAHGGVGPGSDKSTPRAGVLVQADRVWVTVSELGDVVEVRDVGASHDWAGVTVALGDAVRRLESVGLAREATEVVVAAESTDAEVVSYQELITAVDLAHQSGFGQVDLSDPAGLPLRPQP